MARRERAQAPRPGALDPAVDAPGVRVARSGAHNPCTYEKHGLGPLAGQWCVDLTSMRATGVVGPNFK
eukprot:scaffold2621_cov344-Prasinococcus_capsulatus_cf.AAC.5